MDCEVSEGGVAALRREYETLVDAGLGESHEWLDGEDAILAKVPLLPRDSVKVRVPSWSRGQSHGALSADTLRYIGLEGSVQS